MMYTYFLYVHFVLNIVVGIFFLVTVRASNRQELVNYCAEVFTDMSVESSCSRLMSVSTYVFIAIVAALLLIEFCECRYSRVFAIIDLFYLLPRWSADRNSVCVSPAHAEARRSVTTLGLFPRALLP